MSTVLARTFVQHLRHIPIQQEDDFVCSGIWQPTALPRPTRTAILIVSRSMMAALAPRCAAGDARSLENAMRLHVDVPEVAILLQAPTFKFARSVSIHIDCTSDGMSMFRTLVAALRSLTSLCLVTSCYTEPHAAVINERLGALFESDAAPRRLTYFGTNAILRFDVALTIATANAATLARFDFDSPYWGDSQEYAGVPDPEPLLVETLERICARCPLRTMPVARVHSDRRDLQSMEQF